MLRFLCPCILLFLIKNSCKAERQLRPPNDIRVVKTPSSLYVTWSPARRRVAAYKVYFAPSIVTQDTKLWSNVEVWGRASSEVVIPGILPQFDYAISITTMNKAGDESPFSPVVHSSLDSIPDLPDLRKVRNIQIIHRTSHSISIGWLPPIDQRHITAYEVTYHEVGSINPYTRRMTRIPVYALDMLHQGVMYDVAVRPRYQRGQWGLSEHVLVTTGLY